MKMSYASFCIIIILTTNSIYAMDPNEENKHDDEQRIIQILMDELAMCKQMELSIKKAAAPQQENIDELTMIQLLNEELETLRKGNSENGKHISS